MNRDLHYDVMKVLCQSAGFNPNDSQTIAYACQYVDDATSPNKIVLKGFPPARYDEFASFFDGDVFDPVQTGHEGLNYVQSIDGDDQRDVWVSFHFVPNEPFTKPSDENYVTVADGKIVNDLSNRAVEEVKAARADEVRYRRKLIKLGIALHTFADSWSHDDFYGINTKRNKKTDIQVLSNRRWIPDKKTGIKFGPVEVNVGHALCKSQDLSNARWRYRNSPNGPVITKENADRFLFAAEKIHQKLREASGAGEDFGAIKGDVGLALSTGASRDVFRNFDFSYDDREWANAARKFNAIETRNSPGRWWIYDFNGDWKWFDFQLEADDQRKFIKGLIPKRP